MNRVSFTSTFLILTILAFGYFQSERNMDFVENKHFFVKIKNKSDKHIVIFDWGKNYPVESPDSIPNRDCWENEEFFSCVLSPHQSKTKTFGMIHLMSVEELLANKFTNLLFFDFDTINKYGWKEVWLTQKGFLESRIITTNYLKKNKWKICFPATKP